MLDFFSLNKKHFNWLKKKGTARSEVRTAPRLTFQTGFWLSSLPCCVCVYVINILYSHDLEHATYAGTIPRTHTLSLSETDAAVPCVFHQNPTRESSAPANGTPQMQSALPAVDPT